MKAQIYAHYDIATKNVQTIFGMMFIYIYSKICGHKYKEDETLKNISDTQGFL